MAECWARCGGARGACFGAHLALSALLLLGPWHLGKISSVDTGLGVLFPWGLLLRPQGGGAAIYRCADPSLGGALYVWAVILPLTLWLVRAGPRRRMRLQNTAAGLQPSGPPPGPPPARLRPCACGERRHAARL